MPKDLLRPSTAKKKDIPVRPIVRGKKLGKTAGQELLSLYEKGEISDVECENTVYLMGSYSHSEGFTHLTSDGTALQDVVAPNWLGKYAVVPFADSLENHANNSSAYLARAGLISQLIALGLIEEPKDGEVVLFAGDDIDEWLEKLLSNKGEKIADEHDSDFPLELVALNMFRIETKNKVVRKRPVFWERAILGEWCRNAYWILTRLVAKNHIQVPFYKNDDARQWRQIRALICALGLGELDFDDILPKDVSAERWMGMELEYSEFEDMGEDNVAHLIKESEKIRALVEIWIHRLCESGVCLEIDEYANDENVEEAIMSACRRTGREAGITSYVDAIAQGISPQDVVRGIPQHVEPFRGRS